MQFLSPNFCPCLVCLTYFKGILWLSLSWFFHNQYFTRFDSPTELIKLLRSFRKFSDAYTTIRIQQLYREIRAAMPSTCNFSKYLLSGVYYLSVTGFLTALGLLCHTVKKKCFPCSLGSQFSGAHANIISGIFHTRLTSQFTLSSTK